METKNDDLHWEKSQGTLAQTADIKLKGGTNNQTYDKFSDMSSERHRDQMKSTQEHNDFKRAMSNSMQSNFKPRFKDKADKSVKRKATQQFIGMANLGNTCYFNSMMQILYFSDCFADKVCRFDPDKALIPQTPAKSKVPTEKELHKLKMQEKFVENGAQLIAEIQDMFGKMLRGKINYVNPQGVLDHLMEKLTNRKVEVGLQKDLVEFLGMFFECLEAGFSVDRKVARRNRS